MLKITQKRRSEEPSAVRPIPPPKVEAHTDPGASKSIFEALKDEVDAATVAEKIEPNPELRRVKRMSLADFKRDFNKANMLIDGGWGKRGGISMHVSTMGSGKSSLQTQSVLCFNRGVPCCGLRPVRPFKSWVIQSEDDEDRVAFDRDSVIEAMAARHPDQDWEAAVRETEFLDFTGSTGADFIELLNNELNIARRENRMPDAVVINPFNAYFGKDPCDHAACSAFWKGGELGRKETEGMEAVVKRHKIWSWFFAHTAKPPQGARQLREWLNDPYVAYKACGSSATPDAMRSITVFLRVPETNAFVFTAGKNGNGLGWTDADGNKTLRQFCKWSDDGKNGGKRTKIGKTAERIVLPMIEGSAAAGAVLVARGFKGAARGLVRGAMRPDLVLFDDLQDDKAARNQRTVQQYDEMIEKNFLGLGGHDKQIAAFMTSTPICPDDLSEVYAAKKNWKTFTFPMLLSHPDCWGAPGDKWQRYFKIRQEAISAGESEHTAANAFYIENRSEMDAGAAVLNPDFYDHETELSGIQHAMNLRFANGEDSFAAEYQMHPVREHDTFRISAPLIVSRVRKGSMPFTKPQGTVFTAAATDLNPAYAFTTCIVCFDKMQTGFIPYYHLFTGAPLPIPDEIPDQQRVARVFAALIAHGREIAGWCNAHGFGIDSWGVDAGGKQWDAVMRFAAASKTDCGIDCLPMAGRAGRTWNPNVKSKIGAERNGTVMCSDPQRGWRWLAFNADIHRETAQKAWLGEVGSPGGLSLFDGNGTRHAEFAGQVAAEFLEYKVTLQDGRTDYRWKTIGRKHDFGDAVTMCYALAGRFGISAGGFEPLATHKRRRKVYMEN